MEFEIGNMIVVNEESRRYFLSGDELTIYVISELHKDPKIAYAYPLGEIPNSETLVFSSIYRMATDSEVKTYQLKNLFKARGN